MKRDYNKQGCSKLTGLYSVLLLSCLASW